MTLQTATQKLASWLAIDYSKIAYNQLFSDSDLQELVREAHNTIWSLHKWELGETQSAITNTYAASYAYPSSIFPRTGRALFVNGQSFIKRDYTAYLQYQYDVANNNDDVTKPFWAEFDNVIYINKGAYTATDTIKLIGSATVSPLSATTDTLFLTDEAGCDAIVKYSFGIALQSNKQEDVVRGSNMQQEALQVISKIWDRESSGRTKESNDKQIIGFVRVV